MTSIDMDFTEKEAGFHTPFLSERRKTLFLTGASALLLSLVALLTHDTEPAYQGRSLSKWLAMTKIMPGPDHRFPENPEVSEAVRQMGPKAIPFLLSSSAREPHRSGIYRPIRSCVGALPPGVIPKGFRTWLGVSNA